MRIIEFTATGHENIRAMHNTTLEFTKHSKLSLQGDCIIAVNADFDPKQVRELAQNYDKIKIKLKAGLATDSIDAITNKKFESEDEIVIRVGEFESIRTLGIRASKSASQLNRKLIEKLKKPTQSIKITIEGYDAVTQKQNQQKANALLLAQN